MIPIKSPKYIWVFTTGTRKKGLSAGGLAGELAVQACSTTGRDAATDLQLPALVATSLLVERKAP